MSNPSWDDDRIGLPVPGKTTSTISTPRSGSVSHVDEPELRRFDSELGRPQQVSSSMQPLSEDDRHQLQLADEEDAHRAMLEAEELLASEPTILSWAGWLAHPLAAAILVGSAGMMGLFLFSQATTLLANIATQPIWAQYGGYAAVGILSFAVLYAITRLLFIYIRLQRNRQIRLQGLEELQSRTRLRWMAQTKVAEAKRRLETYLKDYPLEPPSQKFRRATLDEERLRNLVVARDRLLDERYFSTTETWFEQFRSEFQSHLDQAAQERIRYWSNRAMIVTAVSPNGFVDSVSTLYFGFALVGDLCKIYHLRAGRTGTAVLLTRVFFNAYLAGNLNDFEKLAEDQYDQLFEQGFQVVGVGMSSNLVGKFLGKVGAKATTGYLNRLLLMRLGRYACRLLRPVSSD